MLVVLSKMIEREMKRDPADSRKSPREKQEVSRESWEGCYRLGGGHVFMHNVKSALANIYTAVPC